jgi:hypothetical protein
VQFNSLSLGGVMSYDVEYFSWWVQGLVHGQGNGAVGGVRHIFARCFSISLTHLQTNIHFFNLKIYFRHLKRLQTVFNQIFMLHDKKETSKPISSK